MWKRVYAYFKQYWELVILILVMTVISGFCHQTSMLEWIRFWGFQFFYLFIPGIAVMILFPMRNLKTIEKVLYSYVTGYMLTIVFYLIIMLTVGSRFLKIFFAVIAVAALAIVYHHIVRNDVDIVDESSGQMWIWTVFVVFIVSLFAVSLRWRVPYIGESNSYNWDYLDWTRKIAAFKREASAFIPMLKDSPYHYLGMIQQAACANLTDISAFGMASQYSHIESSIFLGLSSYVIVDRFIRNKKVQIITLLLILFSTGFEEKVAVSYTGHIYLVAMSYHIAQSLGVMVILLILMQLNEEFDFHKLLMTVALLMCCTGTKGATGAVIFGGIAMACLYSFFIQNKKKIALIYFVFTLVGFGLVYAYLMPTAQKFSDQAFRTFGEADSEDVINAADNDIVDNENTVNIERESLLRKGFEKAGGYIKYFVCLNPWTMLPMLIFICYLVVHRSLRKEYLILFTLTMAGTILGYFIHYFGHSEMYFALTVFPFAALLSGCFIDVLFLHIISSGWQSVIMGALCSSVILFTVYFDYGGEFRFCLVKGLDNWWIFHDNVIENRYGEIGLDYHEYYAYEWIRMYTPPDALILTNRIRNNQEWFLFYSLTERDLVGGDGYLEEPELFDQYSDLGVDYIVFNKDLGQFDCPSDKGEILFENNKMIICELY